MLRNSKYVQCESATESDVEHLNIGQTVKQIERIAAARKHEEEFVVSVVLIIVGGSEVAAGKHGTTAACLRQKGCVQNRMAGTRKNKTMWDWQLGERVAPKNHVAAAVSCCLEMALWRTLWMVDQVSLTAIGGLSASLIR